MAFSGWRTGPLWVQASSLPPEAGWKACTTTLRQPEYFSRLKAQPDRGNGTLRNTISSPHGLVSEAGRWDESGIGEESHRYFPRDSIHRAT